RATPDGDEWVITGQKVWTTSAHLATYGLVLARTDPDVPKHRGITAFIIEMGSPGIEVRPLRQMSGAADFNEVYLTDVRVPDANRVGGIGDGWSVALTTLMNERVSIGAKTGPRGSGTIAFAAEAWNRYGHTDPGRRDALMALWIEAEVLRLGSIRAQQ